MPDCDEDDNGLAVKLARLDERIKAQARDIVRAEQFNDRALELAATGLDRHLETLNGHAAEIRSAQEKHSNDMLRAQALLQSKEFAERDKTEMERRFAKIEDRMGALERGGASLQGKLWLPLLVAAGAAAAFAAGLVKLLSQ